MWKAFFTVHITDKLMPVDMMIQSGNRIIERERKKGKH
jgi:hypothetical protein